METYGSTEAAGTDTLIADEEEHNAAPSLIEDEQHEPATEDTPLLSPRSSHKQRQDPNNEFVIVRGVERIVPVQDSESSLYLFLLCLGIGGLQMAWATELSNGSPYLLSLGMSKSHMAMVWIAGPLSGVLVQPIIGSLSDNCKISWGRRRPYMLAGTAATVLSLLALAWTKEIVSGGLAFFAITVSAGKTMDIALGFAIAWIYILDFSVNTLQASIRAFIVDNAPAHQQDQANAWASRIVGFGNIIGYISGYVNLPMLFPYFGDSQFKVLCAISCIVLLATVLLSCYCIREADPRTQWPSAPSSVQSITSFFKGFLTSFARLTAQTQMVCTTQFFNWMGWFPFLFYITTYVGQLYLNPLFEENPHLDREQIDRAWEEATRFGAFALLMFAVVSFAASSLLPLFIEPIYTNPQGLPRRSIVNLYIPHLTIRRAWLASHLLFAVCMFSTAFITTAAAATAMTSIVGLCWAMTLWAPFALISTDISKRDMLKRARVSGVEYVEHVEAATMGPPDADIREPSVEIAARRDPEDEGEGRDKVEDQAGVVLGLHNVAVSAPQIIATVISSLIFHLAQRERGVAGDDSVGWVLRFGGVAALAAAWRTLKILEAGDDCGGARIVEVTAISHPMHRDPNAI